MIRTVRAIPFLFLSLPVVAQNGGNAPATGNNDPVLMTVDESPVTRSEFEAIYKKNNKDAPVTKEALDEYLDLFINYKLKVREAEALGMDTVQKFKTELDGYRKQLARPYLIDRELNETLMKEAFDRSQEEIHASHILVKLPDDPSPEDTLAAWKKINAIRDRVMNGEDFGAVARSVSDDPSAKQNDGNLGWFSALQMVYPFETAAYRTPVGQVSKPVRTRFGYHIIKVTGRRPARGQIRVAHIMLRSTDQDPPEKQQEVERRINEIYKQLKDGSTDFSDAALRYSEDESTNTRGGELPIFGTGKMIEEFEDAAFSLANDNDISKPFRTRYGWHIVKRLEYVPPPSYDQAKGDLKSRIARDSRAEITRRAFLQELRKDYHFTPDPKALKPIVAMLDSTIFQKGSVVMDTLIRKNVAEGDVTHDGKRYRREVNGVLHQGKVVNVRSRKYDDLNSTPEDTVVVRDVQEGWSYDRSKASKLKKDVFTIDGGGYTQQEFLDYLEAGQHKEKGVDFKTYVDERFQQFVDDKVLEFEDAHLDEKYPEFRMLMKEYRDGILLFELTDEKVWSKAVKDTTGAEAYYEAHKNDFMWDTRYEADIYSCANADVAKKVRALYKKGKRGNDIATETNKQDPLAVNVESGTWTSEEKPFLKGVTKPGLGDNIEKDGKVLIVDMHQVLPPSPKSFEEARGAVTAAYQDQLEKDWIAELRAKYPVRVNKDVLYSIH
ncbi:MAG: peptidylprolyl isomerase [Flavobacteriales bacterium]|nr:peptidylprolyl isomerase [Flavobacteriales bacterium]MCB9193596.1 peptidylprolyl isomerase [Flavobacteriales bacterium]